jgi:hypothetical protein
MVNNCTLVDWQTNSRCAHAVAPTPSGPFLRRDVAVPVWCHNPEVRALQINGTRVYALFHIGDGTGNPKHCNTTVGFGGSAPPVRMSAPSTVHSSLSLDGPWAPVPGFPSCNNPSVLQHANGTLYALCDSKVLWRAEQLEGPWRSVVTLNLQGGPDCVLEDGFVWIDTRGSWHVLFHCWSNVIPPSGSCVNTNVSAHAFSPDGTEWAIWPSQPFDGP